MYIGDLWDHARGITRPLAESLADLQVRLAGADPLCVEPQADAIREAITVTWPGAVADAAAGRADLSGGYLASLHSRLATAAGAAAPGEFTDDGRTASWNSFLAELTAEGPPEEAYVLAELYWGGHVRSMALSLGWLCMNMSRLQTGKVALHPPLCDYERLVRFFGYSGPSSYDAESLRALQWEYDRDQRPTQVARAEPSGAPDRGGGK